MEVEGLEKTISALEHDKQELVEKERATVVNVTRLEKDVEGLERTISALENEKKYWGNQLSAANDKLKRLEGVAQAGGRAMDTIREEKEHLNQQLIIAETQLKMSRTAINPHEQELVEQTVRLALNAAAERESKNLDQVQEKVEGIRNGLKMIQAAHTLDLEDLELRTANHNLTNQMGPLQSRIDEQSIPLKERCGLADEERAEFETTLRQELRHGRRSTWHWIRRTIAQLSFEVAHAKEADVLKGKLETMNIKNEELRIQVTALQQKVSLGERLTIATAEHIPEGPPAAAPLTPTSNRTGRPLNGLRVPLNLILTAKRGIDEVEQSPEKASPSEELRKTWKKLLRSYEGPILKIVPPEGMGLYRARRILTNHFRDQISYLNFRDFCELPLDQRTG
ncbi:uncharacterized protein RSE6_11674 [Rhynchosporium secalis]|uniref:Uncharacterized protein n=1 Tax=Rhynchosporium secalis TaxID=38038 RepID=A0A1E1MNH4_RHYSE|nr:uncharacterized protein RSE6_11674 [Rhynchosporium secalis]